MVYRSGLVADPNPTPRQVVRFPGLRPRFRHQNNRAALVPECHPHLVSQVLLILAGEKLFAVHKKKERGRRWPYLCGVIELEPLPVRAQHVAVVRGEDDDRVVRDVKLIKGLEQPAHLLVDGRDRRVVGGDLRAPAAGNDPKG